MAFSTLPQIMGRTIARRVSFVASNDGLRRLWIGRTTSVVGDRMFAVGAIWIAWTLTHSSVGVACIILAESVPFMAWGLLQRRIKLRVGVGHLVMLDALRAALLFVLLAQGLTSPASQAFALVLVASVAFSTAIFEPAFRSLIPELSPGDGRLAYASFDLGGRLARIAGPLLAAAITWQGSPKVLLAVDAVTFLVSAACLVGLTGSHAKSSVARSEQQPAAGMERLSPFSQALLVANGLGTFALIVWWLALPIAASHHSHGAMTYGLCIGMSAAGGIVANLVLGSAPDRHEPKLLSVAGWAVTGSCMLALTSNPAPLTLLALSFVCGAALCAAALGFSFHAAGLDMPVRNQLFQRDQVIMRTAGACGAIGGGLALQYRPDAVIVSAASLLIVLAVWIWWHQRYHVAAAPVAVVDR